MVTNPNELPFRARVLVSGRDLWNYGIDLKIAVRVALLMYKWRESINPSHPGRQAPQPMIEAQMWKAAIGGYPGEWISARLPTTDLLKWSEKKDHPPAAGGYHI
jgi:hypothetical protein